MASDTRSSFDILYDDLKSEKVDELEQALKDRKYQLKFKPEQEKAFQQYYANRYKSHMRLALLMSTAMFLLSYLFDFIYVPLERMSILIRFGIVAPVVFLMIVLAFTPLYKKYQQGIMLISALALSFGLLAITYHMPDPMRIMYVNGSLLVCVYAICFARIFFANALTFAGVNFVAINFLLYLEPGSGVHIFLAHNYIYLCGCILLLANNYSRERSDRQTYLQKCLIKEEKIQLEKINTHLHELANMDALTNLANIRAFDHALANEWRRAKRYQYPIALLMFDFDQFKALNDTYGHQGGDDALQAVAAALKDVGKRPGDLAARYGGDEFVMMLVGTDTQSAIEIAEATRLAIEALAIPNKNSNVKPIVTTTIGVASIVPSEESDESQLFKQADDALYVAKNRGRNCVCSVLDIEQQQKTA